MSPVTLDLPAHVVVAGGSRGFGLALARRLAAAGSSVANVSRSAPPDGVYAADLRLDLSDARAAERLAAWARDELRAEPASLVYCAASTGAVGWATEVPPRAVAEVVATGLVGFAAAVTAFVPALLAHRTGSVLLVGSRAARDPLELLAAYAADKAAQHQYTAVLARELRSSGVRANVLCVNADTDLVREHVRTRAALRGQEAPDLGLPSPEDNTDAALFLLSAQAAGVSGQTVETWAPAFTAWGNRAHA